jgi:hypothetical protein
MQFPIYYLREGETFSPQLMGQRGFLAEALRISQVSLARKIIPWEMTESLKPHFSKGSSKGTFELSEKSLKIPHTPIF